MSNVYLDLAKDVNVKEDPYEILASQIGPAINDYRKKWQLAGKGKIELEYPLHLNIELMYGCNLRCEFCLLSLPANQQKYSAKPGDKIPFEKYCEIVDEGLKHGLCSIALNGYNEPLLQKDIARYVQYARTAGVIDVNLHTNGLLLTDQLAEELIASGLTIIMFSLDAFSPAIYKKIRKSDGYNLAVENVLKFINIRNSMGKILPLVKVSFVKTKVNQNDLDGFIKFWKHRADFITIQTLTSPFVGNKKDKKFEEEYRVDSLQFTKCFEPYQRLMITSDGNVLPCCSHYGLEISLGNIYHESVYQVWNSKHFKEMRCHIGAFDGKQPPPCIKCQQSTKTQ
ncbi:MAG: Molybdopterin cofactor synthesis protein A [Parcubacteria group bacterium GW2011_GWA2_38_13]|nr:MAG: Molybdopterin cofactor synthesis protein A [Parcubacteria group bacterium GW2011_GWA2_38_13]